MTHLERPSVFTRTLNLRKVRSKVGYRDLLKLKQNLQHTNRAQHPNANDQPLEYISAFVELAVQAIARKLCQQEQDFMRPHFGAVNDLAVYILAQNHRDIVRHLYSLHTFIRSFETHYIRDSTESDPRLVRFKESCDSVLSDGRYLCSLVQERMQIDTSLASIRESKKSIEEAVVVKRLTRLAFVFIPLTYSSSLFGMNIREMTGEGPRIWNFVAVSICIGLITPLLYGLARLLNKWVSFEDYAHDIKYLFRWLRMRCLPYRASRR